MKARWLCLGLVLLGLGPPVEAASTASDRPKTFQVPYRLTDTQHVLVRVKINGKGPFNFIIDTGAPALFVARPVCKKLGVAADKTGWGTFDRFEIEGGVVEVKAKGRVETPFQLEGMNALGLAGADVHGMIGYNILARYRIEYDFTRDKMTWTRLNFDPGLPKGLRGKGGAPGGLDTLGSIMKMIGMFIGKKQPPELLPRGFLGFEVVPAEGKIEGVVIKKVLASGPAAAAGLRAGDRITHFQGEEIDDVDDVQYLAGKLKAGQEARFTVQRNGTTHKITFKVGEGL
jgi:hypothetical protein